MKGSGKPEQTNTLISFSSGWKNAAWSAVENSGVFITQISSTNAYSYDRFDATVRGDGAADLHPVF